MRWRQYHESRVEKAVRLTGATMQAPESGSQIRYHRVGYATNGPALMDENLNFEVLEHITRHVGPIASVLDGVAGALVKANVALVPPSEDRPFQTLVTCGMSGAPMPAKGTSVC